MEVVKQTQAAREELGVLAVLEAVVGVVGEPGRSPGLKDVPVLADLSEVAWDGVLVTEGDDAPEVQAELARLEVSRDRVWLLA